MLCLALAMVWNCAAVTQAADLKVEVKLIWGSNADSSPDPKHKKLDTNLTEFFKKTYKWKNYFEVNRKNVTIPEGKQVPVPLSDVCKVEVKYLGGNRIEVKLYGHGKLVITGIHNLPQNDRLVIAGDDKNDSAWFIAFKRL